MRYVSIGFCFMLGCQPSVKTRTMSHCATSAWKFVSFDVKMGET